MPDDPPISSAPLRERSEESPKPLGTRDFFTPVLHVASLCYFLALPILAVLISIDIDFGGRWMCDPRPVGALGTVYDHSGNPICQFEVSGVLLFWTLCAAAVSPIPMSGVYLWRHVKRIRYLRSAADRTAKVRLWRAFFLNIALCILFAAVAGRGWVLSVLLLPGAVLAVYIYRFVRAVQKNETIW